MLLQASSNCADDDHSTIPYSLNCWFMSVKLLNIIDENICFTLFFLKSSNDLVISIPSLLVEELKIIGVCVYPLLDIWFKKSFKIDLLRISTLGSDWLFSYKKPTHGWEHTIDLTSTKKYTNDGNDIKRINKINNRKLFRNATDKDKAINNIKVIQHYSAIILNYNKCNFFICILK